MARGIARSLCDITRGLFVFVFRGKYFINRKVFGDWDIRVEQVNIASLFCVFCYFHGFLVPVRFCLPVTATVGSCKHPVTARAARSCAGALYAMAVRVCVRLSVRYK